jgi:hypothetical protein
MMKPGKRFFTLTVFSCLLMLVIPALAAPKFNGKWRLTIEIPEAPNSPVTRIFTVDADVAPRDGSLHGRMTLTDFANHTVGGVWRQSGKSVSITYELPCAGTEPCASLVMLGKIKNENTVVKKGKVIVMWDSPNSTNHAQYDTSNGTFSGVRLE